MCNERTVNENKMVGNDPAHASGRGAPATADIARFEALWQKPANALAVAASDVKIETPDGMADCYFVHPASGAYPAVMVWPDALGLRAAFRAMGKRLAQSGYAVLVINPYYRVTTAPIDIDWESLSDPGSDWNEDLFNTVMGLWKAVTPEMTKTDAIAFAAYLDRQKPVDPKRKMGTAGYCMGGPEVLRTAAALPDRVGALASFHGGYMVTPEPSSPHWLVPKTSAQAIIAIGANDDKDNPNEKSVYREAYEKAKLPAEIEVYGAMHSWCIPDSKAYHPAQSDRAWSRLLALFERALI